jgi:hypothetical protein
MTLTLSLVGFALLFVAFGVLRGHDRCKQNCGSCSSGCRRLEENEDV